MCVAQIKIQHIYHNYNVHIYKSLWKWNLVTSHFDFVAASVAALRNEDWGISINLNGSVRYALREACLMGVVCIVSPLLIFSSTYNREVIRSCRWGDYHCQLGCLVTVLIVLCDLDQSSKQLEVSGCWLVSVVVYTDGPWRWKAPRCGQLTFTGVSITDNGSQD